jgi:acyl carrier protein
MAHLARVARHWICAFGWSDASPKSYDCLFNEAGGTMAKTENEIVWFMVRWLSEQLRREVGADANFAALGLDSIDMVRLTDALAEDMGVEELPISLVLDHPTISALAAQLVTLQTEAAQ